MSKYNHTRTKVYNINHHIVWSTKRRRKVLFPKLEEDIKYWIKDIARENGFAVSAIEAGHKDHIHVFVSSDPYTPASKIASLLKGITARKAFAKYPFLEKVYLGHHMWNPSTYIESVGCISEEQVKRYIEHQKDG